MIVWYQSTYIICHLTSLFFHYIGYSQYSYNLFAFEYFKCNIDQIQQSKEIQKIMARIYKDLAIKKCFLILKIAMIFEFLVKLVFELWRLCIEELLFLLTLTHWRHKEIALFLSRCSWPSKISPRKLLFCVPWSNVTDYKRKYILQIVNKMT